MELKIIDEKQAPLLSRNEISAEISFEQATPSKEELKKKIAGQKKADENLVVVKKIYTNFGSKKAAALVYIYDSKESMKRMETRTSKQRKAERQPAEKKEGEKKEETPAEKAEEAKPEKPEEKEEKQPEESAEKAEEKPKPEEKPSEKTEEKKGE